MGNDQYSTAIYRKAFKTITWTASGGDFISYQGPFDEATIGLVSSAAVGGTVTAPIYPATARLIGVVSITSNKHGQVALLNGPALYDLFAAYWGNGFYYVETATGASASMIGSLPITADEDESLNFQFTFGALANAASGLTTVTANIRMTFRILNQNPSTYWAYRVQPIAATGATTTVQQPLIPVLPGYSLIGEVIEAHNTALTTASDIVANIGNFQLYQSGVPVVDDSFPMLLAPYFRRVYNQMLVATYTSGVVGYVKHIPLSNNDGTNLAMTTVAAVVAGSQMVYIYQSGQVTPATGQAAGTGVQPTVEVPTSKGSGSTNPGMPNIQAKVGPAGGKGLLGNLGISIS